MAHPFEQKRVVNELLLASTEQCSLPTLILPKHCESHSHQCSSWVQACCPAADHTTRRLKMTVAECQHPHHQNFCVCPPWEVTLCVIGEESVQSMRKSPQNTMSFPLFEVGTWMSHWLVLRAECISQLRSKWADVHDNSNENDLRSLIFFWQSHCCNVHKGVKNGLSPDLVKEMWTTKERQWRIRFPEIQTRSKTNTLSLWHGELKTWRKQGWIGLPDWCMHPQAKLCQFCWNKAVLMHVVHKRRRPCHEAAFHLFTWKAKKNQKKWVLFAPICILRVFSNQRSFMHATQHASTLLKGMKLKELLIFFFGCIRLGEMPNHAGLEHLCRLLQVAMSADIFWQQENACWIFQNLVECHMFDFSHNFTHGDLTKTRTTCITLFNATVLSIHCSHEAQNKDFLQLRSFHWRCLHVNLERLGAWILSCVEQHTRFWKNVLPDHIVDGIFMLMGQCSMFGAFSSHGWHWCPSVMQSSAFVRSAVAAAKTSAQRGDPQRWPRVSPRPGECQTCLNRILIGPEQPKQQHDFRRSSLLSKTLTPSEFVLHSCWMTEGPPTVVCFLSCFCQVPIADSGKLNQQASHDKLFSRPKRSSTRSCHALCNKSNKKNDAKMSCNWFTLSVCFKMTFDCIWWQAKLSDRTRDTNAVKGNPKGDRLALKAFREKDQMSMKRWGIWKLLQWCLMRVETPPADCRLQQWSHVLAVTFCNPVDHWWLKKQHCWSAFLLHCESPFRADFDVDFEFARSMHKESGHRFFPAGRAWRAWPTKEFGSKSHPWVVWDVSGTLRVWDLVKFHSAGTTQLAGSSPVLQQCWSLDFLDCPSTNQLLPDVWKIRSHKNRFFQNFSWLLPNWRLMLPKIRTVGRASNDGC